VAETLRRGLPRVTVDTRPLWRVLLAHASRPLILLLGIGAYLLIRYMPPLTDLGAPGQRALAVFVICLVYWVSGVLPLMVTSILAMVLLPQTGVISAKDTYALFGNEAVFFILAHSCSPPRSCAAGCPPGSRSPSCDGSAIPPGRCCSRSS
jgi:hypothetical protein